jgi:predicted nucleic acid-binding protein
MGLKPTIYFDACIAIYLVEEHPIYCAPIEEALSAKAGIVCYSPLVVLESLVLPIQKQRDDLIRKFRIFFAANQRLAMPDEVFELAANYRAKHRLKTPDALHLAAARYHGCAELWTNDDRLNGAAGATAVNVLAGVRS